VLELEPELEVNGGVLAVELFERGNVVKIAVFIEKQRGLFVPVVFRGAQAA
jgi:hypothetical protein